MPVLGFSGFARVLGFLSRVFSGFSSRVSPSRVSGFRVSGFRVSGFPTIAEIGPQVRPLVPGVGDRLPERALRQHLPGLFVQPGLERRQERPRLPPPNRPTLVGRQLPAIGLDPDDGRPIYAQEVCGEGPDKLDADGVRKGSRGVALGGAIQAVDPARFDAQSAFLFGLRAKIVF
jgi:hypothetical protein